MLQSVQSENVPFVGAYVSLCDLACTFMSYPLLDDLFLSASRHLCSYFAVCLPSVELPINHLWVNIQKLRTLCSINRSLNRSLIGADSRTHLSRSLFVDPPIPTEFLGALRTLQWQENGFSSDSAGASATCFILMCDMQERWDAALLYLGWRTSLQGILSSLQS